MTKLFAGFDFSKLPRKVEIIDLADYHESLSDQPKIAVWVNLTKALFDEWELKLYCSIVSRMITFHHCAIKH